MHAAIICWQYTLLLPQYTPFLFFISVYSYLYLTLPYPISITTDFSHASREIENATHLNNHVVVFGSDRAVHAMVAG